MRLLEALHLTDALCPNAYSKADKLRWLSELDGKLKQEIMDTHAGGEALCFSGYGEASDPATVLLVPAPYDGLYVKYLEMQIHYFNGETQRYSNAATAFEAAYREFSGWYHRTHRPLGAQKTFW